MKYQLNFYTSHHQFYILDKDVEAATDSPNFWNKAAFESALAMERGVIGIGTECYGHVKAELELFETEPPITDFDKWDKITEGGIKIQSGYLQVQACVSSDIELELSVGKGSYRVRVYGANLASVVGDDGDDFYRIEIWRDDNLKRKVVKKYAK